MVCGTDKLDQGLRNPLLPYSGIHLQNKNCRLFYSAISNTAESLSCPDDLLAPFTAVTDRLIRIYICISSVQLSLSLHLTDKLPTRRFPCGACSCSTTGHFTRHCDTRRFIIIFTRAQLWTLFWATLIQITSSNSSYLKRILILSRHIYSSFQGGHFQIFFLTNFCIRSYSHFIGLQLPLRTSFDSVAGTLGQPKKEPSMKTP
jgi:hypothetical protein